MPELVRAELLVFSAHDSLGRLVLLSSDYISFGSTPLKVSQGASRFEIGQAPISACLLRARRAQNTVVWYPLSQSALDRPVLPMIELAAAPPTLVNPPSPSVGNWCVKIGF
jgi:hypothetical protein